MVYYVCILNYNGLKKILSSLDTLRTGSITSFAYQVFLNEINNAIIETDKNYSKMLYREALKTGFYDFQAARDNYRLVVQSDGFHRDLILKFIKIQALLLSPITPHFSEYIWELLGNKDSIMNVLWPEAQPPDTILLKSSAYLHSTIKLFRQRKLFLENQSNKSKKEKVNIYVASSFPEWQEMTLVLLKTLYEKKKKSIPRKR